VPRILWNGLVSDEIDEEHRLLQALNCLLVETPAGRVLVETGIGERVSDKVRAMRRYEGPAIVPALRTAGFDPETVNVVAMSHLHFDHAGGLLLGDGARAFPRATIVAQRSEWEIALGDNSRLVASYDQPENTRRAIKRSSFEVRAPAPGRSRSSATCSCGRGPPTRAG
jgi:glyoxylase-like metal-dependent hydrolase (beta-lactamase superfamily II)